MYRRIKGKSLPCETLRIPANPRVLFANRDSHALPGEKRPAGEAANAGPYDDCVEII
jgi:hypothetical protein